MASSSHVSTKFSSGSSGGAFTDALIVMASMAQTSWQCGSQSAFKSPDRPMAESGKYQTPIALHSDLPSSRRFSHPANLSSAVNQWQRRRLSILKWGATRHVPEMLHLKKYIERYRTGCLLRLSQRLRVALPAPSKETVASSGVTSTSAV